MSDCLCGKERALSEEELNEIALILEKYRDTRGALIPVLQEIQGHCGYLPRQAMEMISAEMGLPLSKVYGVATFYAQFHLEPRGRNVVRVCLGTACHVRGGERILERLGEQLGIPPGGTTEDLRFTLERVACLGACGLAPAMMVNDETFGRLTPEKAKKLIQKFE